MALKIAGLVGELCADGINICLRTHQSDAEPMVSVANLVPQQNRRAIVLGHKNIHAAVVVKISQRKSAGGQLFREDGATRRADVLETSPGVLKQNHRFKIIYVWELLLDHQVRVTVRHEEVEVAVIVIVEELCSPAAQQPGSR